MIHIAPIIYAQTGRGARWALSIACVAAAALIGIADYELGLEVSLLGLHVLPVVAAAWYGVAGAGYLASIAAGVSLLFVDRLSGTLYSSDVLAYWDSLANGLTLAALAALTRIVRLQLRYERRVARVDGLTGALTAQAFREALAQEALRACRFGHALTLVYFDLDRLKAVHDTAGHRAGDRLMRSFVSGVRRCIRDVDRIGRMGGGEFVLLLPETGLAEGTEVLRRLHGLVRNEPGFPSFSSGLVAFTGLPEGTPEGSAEFADTALDLADGAMNQAKRWQAGGIVGCTWFEGRIECREPWIPESLDAPPGAEGDPVALRLLRGAG